MTVSARSAVRVAVLDDHALFAQSLELVLSIEGYDVRRVEIPTNEQAPRAMLASVLKLQPRIVLLDLDLGLFGDGVRLVNPIATTGANVVVVTSSVDRGRWGEAIHQGARTVISKSLPLSTILATVRRLHHNLPVLDIADREQLLQCRREQRAELENLRARLELLSARETQVLGHLMRGQTVREIAATSFVSEATVRTQVKSVLAKLEVSSQLAAVGLAYQVGWQPPQDTR